MNLIPNEFKINGDVVIRFDQEGLVMLAMAIIIIVIISLLAQRFIKAM